MAKVYILETDDQLNHEMKLFIDKLRTVGMLCHKNKDAELATAQADTEFHAHRLYPHVDRLEILGHSGLVRVIKTLVNETN